MSCSSVIPLLSRIKIYTLSLFSTKKETHLVLALVDSSVDGSEKGLPSHTKGLHGIARGAVLEDEVLLHLLVDPLQFVDVRLVLQRLQK